MTTSNVTPATGAGENPPEPREAFSEYREDGWPLCPACGDDGIVFSVDYGFEHSASGENIICYKCGWTAKEFLLGFRM
jgi:hypothetical protein